MGFVFLQGVEIGTTNTYTNVWEQRKYQAEFFFILRNLNFLNK